MPSSISSEVSILLIFLNVATRGFGNFLLVNNFITLAVSLPDIRITATPEIPGPVDRAYIVIYNNVIIINNNIF
jgi:hypothetical protein